MKKIKFIILFFSLAYQINSQVQQEWVQRYNGPGNAGDVANSVVVDALGNIYVTGMSNGSGTAQDYTTIKYNSSGVQQWLSRYNGPGNGYDYAHKVVVDGSGNVYVTGNSYISGTLDDYVTIKYNSFGVQQWVQRYNGPGNYTDESNSLAVDDSGNVYVIGNSWGNGTGFDCTTIKYNSAGVQLWVQRYNSPENGYDYGNSLVVDDSSNVYVTGSSWGGWTYGDYVTIKYNSSGIQQWIQFYNGPGNWGDEAGSIVLDSWGNLYITGASKGTDLVEDYATIKYNSLGVQQWVARYDGPAGEWDVATSLAVDDSGNVFVTGVSVGNGTGHDYATIKYNSSGVEQWVCRYNEPGSNVDEAYSLTLDIWGNVYVTGYSVGSGTSWDYATVKYNSSGVQLWVQRYDGPGNNHDVAKSIAVDVLGNVYVTGNSEGIGSGYDYVTIKYSQLDGITPISNPMPSAFRLSQNYPNPFNPTTKIKFDIPPSKGARGMTQLIIYDVLGREIATIVNEQLQPGTYEVEWDGSNYPSGVYFYQLSINNEQLATKKMVLIK